MWHRSSDVIPIVGTLLGAGLALFAGVVAAALSLVTIAIRRAPRSPA